MGPDLHPSESIPVNSPHQPFGGSPTSSSLPVFAFTLPSQPDRYHPRISLRPDSCTCTWRVCGVTRFTRVDLIILPTETLLWAAADMAAAGPCPRARPHARRHPGSTPRLAAARGPAMCAAACTPRGSASNARRTRPRRIMSPKAVGSSPGFRPRGRDVRGAIGASVHRFLLNATHTGRAAGLRASAAQVRIGPCAGRVGTTAPRSRGRRVEPDFVVFDVQSS